MWVCFFLCIQPYLTHPNHCRISCVSTGNFLSFVKQMTNSKVCTEHRARTKFVLHTFFKILEKILKPYIYFFTGTAQRCHESSSKIKSSQAETGWERTRCVCMCCHLEDAKRHAWVICFAYEWVTWRVVNTKLLPCSDLNSTNLFLSPLR